MTQDWTVPSIFPATHLQVASEFGFAPEQILARAKCSTGSIQGTGRGMKLSDYERLLAVMASLKADLAVGFEVGKRLPPTAFGSLGQVMLSSPTAGEALKQCQRFWHLYVMGLRMSVETRHGLCHLEVDTLTDLDSGNRSVIMESVIFCLSFSIERLLPQLGAETEIWFDYAEPAYGPSMRAHFSRIRFDMPSCQLRFPDHWLLQPLPFANQAGFAAGLAQCEHEARLHKLKDQGVVGQVQSALTLGTEGYPKLMEVARQLNKSPRTLRRQLQDAGTTFSALLDVARRRDAMAMLEQDGVQIQHIAVVLGYSEPANFTRAFRHWCNQTPTEYRRSHCLPKTV